MRAMSFEAEVFVRPFNFGGVLFRGGGGGGGGGVDRQCLGGSKVRRHGLGTVIG